MLQIFDCAFIIGWRLLSHGATVTLLVSQLRWTHIDLYRLPPKSIMNPRKECQKGASGWWWLWRSVCAIPAMASCFVFCSPVVAIKTTAYTACKGVGNNPSSTQIQFSRLFFFFLMRKKLLKKKAFTQNIFCKEKDNRHVLLWVAFTLNCASWFWLGILKGSSFNVRYCFTTRSHSFALHADHNKPATCTSPSASGAASTESPLRKQGHNVNTTVLWTVSNDEVPVLQARGCPTWHFFVFL